MKRIKINKYTVWEKGRAYEILKFPFIRPMWAFDCHPEENMLMVDGCKQAFMWMKYAFAILANDCNKIIYFPCRQEGLGGYYTMPTYHLVLYRPELQLRRSLWFRMKGKLDRKHASGKYVLSYDRKKLDDYFISGLGKKYKMEEDHSGRKCLPSYLTYGKKNRERLLGDTMFIEMPWMDWLMYHYETALDLDGYRSGKRNYIWSAIGWIISDENIRDMYRLEAEEKRNRRKKLEELQDIIVIPELDENGI